MDELSILIGGRAGFGIDRAGGIIGRLLNRMGYHIYIYRDYPSIIRGGHTFSIIRASKNRIASHRDKIDVILALNQDTLDFHKKRLNEGCFFIFDSEQVKPQMGPNCGLGLPLGKLLKEELAPEIMRNTCIIGALTKAIGADFGILEDTLKKELAKDLDLNLKVARRGFDAARELFNFEPLQQKSLPFLTGNQALALGLIKGGLNAYISYPMTPSSPILHYLAEIGDDFGLDVIHPESEISVILMALGYAYAGKKVAVGTSGGGFCLMTEGLSLAGMAELPVVVILGQRPGPSTGLPTYSAQSDLHFALNAGQGEFARFVVAPGDAEEAYYWSAASMNISWKYQIPGIILTDKNLGEGIFNFDLMLAGEIKEEGPVLWNGESTYKRYSAAKNGVSPLAFAPSKDAVIKVNSYEHDESGITTEEPQQTKMMQEKRLRKEKYLALDLENFNTVKVHAEKESETALLCWGSNKGVCVEAARRLGLRAVQPVVLNPFGAKQFQEALAGVKKLILVENNATGQLMRLIGGYGFKVDKQIFKYDGRPFSLEELEEEVKGAIK
ncbi:MAG: 2-oxoacid:acceptor oxidoreductase subunit alpha [Candidatus Omnitrophica bacterium]|nr:2-oxoacid:acceptor oxidoreductase subunit alpha [Candidatus Omnitrophota bacterium]MDD5592768.1 2-oxoacid:acceptor oxidoreductase subunit alpha [Candidatus Omnitrophota bacterium]